MAARILKATENLGTNQDTKPLKKKNRPSKPDSPGHTIDKVIREREAIQAFVLYLRTHIAHSSPDDVGYTPLNTHTVLKAAIRNISVGDEMHFQRVVFYNPYTEIADDGRTQAVLQIDIDPALKDAKGRINIERMHLGKSPIGPDERRINLHHVNQEDGLLMELFGSTHTRLSRDLHFRRGLPSKINRSAFSFYRNAYWKWRGEALEKLLKEDDEIKRKYRLVAQALSAQAANIDQVTAATDLKEGQSGTMPCPPVPPKEKRVILKATRTRVSAREMR
ncbi:MAG: hypothetical protein H6925_03935 [Holosporaceae bacterium]|nr:MAG: hypothetical protein H6925_03935 [Holosporaceae bacterium]